MVQAPTAQEFFKKDNQFQEQPNLQYKSDQTMTHTMVGYADMIK